MLQQLLSKEVIDRLPSPRGVAMALTNACQKPNVHLEEITSLVRTDPALSGRLLGVANVSTQGGRSVASVDAAVARLGVATVSRIALAFSLIDQHSVGHCSNFDYAGFWSQSLLMAAASAELGDAQGMGPASELFTVGLLSQIGRLALATAYPNQYSELLGACSDKQALWACEQALSQTNQLQLSAAMMEHWCIPAEWAQPFAYRDPALLPASGYSSMIEHRTHLAREAMQLAITLAKEGLTALTDEAQCARYLQWLNIDRDDWIQRVGRIESGWCQWLGLTLRNGR